MAILNLITKLLIITILLHNINYTSSSIQFLTEETNEKETNEFIATSLAETSTKTNFILPGMGYSSDIESYAPTVCYNYITMSKIDQHSDVKFDQSVTSKTLINEFNFKTSLAGGYGIFKASGEISYLDSVIETDHSITLHYYQKIGHTVALTYSYNPDDILNSVGKSIYSEGTKPMFRVLCGDYLIKSYEEGAGLIYTFVIVLSSKEEKEDFKGNFESGLMLGSLLKVTGEIKKFSTNKNINGQMKITAFQYGGDPVNVSKILSGNIVNCDIQKTEDCGKTIEQLISYATNDFPSQFKGDDNALESNKMIFTGKYEKDYYVADFGLKLASTFVTSEVEEKRKQLIRNIRKMYYYNSKLKELKNQYKYSDINWNFLINAVEDLLTAFDEGYDLYKYPNRAVEIYNALMKKFNYENIENRILKIIDHGRYAYVYNDANHTTIYATGLNTYMCDLKSITIQFKPCFAFGFGEFFYSLMTPLVFMPEYYLFKCYAKYDEKSDAYVGEISNGLIKVNITGKKILHRNSVKRFEDIEDELYIN